MRFSVILGFAALAVALPAASPAAEANPAPQRGGRGGGGRGGGGRGYGGRGGGGGGWNGGGYGYNPLIGVGELGAGIVAGATEGLLGDAIGFGECVLGGPWNCRTAAGEAIPEPAVSIQMKADASAAAEN